MDKKAIKDAKGAKVSRKSNKTLSIKKTIDIELDSESESIHFSGEDSEGFVPIYTPLKLRKRSVRFSIELPSRTLRS